MYRDYSDTVIKYNRFVGIGKTDPEYQMDVSGRAHIDKLWVTQEILV